MDIRRLIRGPILWIVFAVALVMVGSSLLSGMGAPEQVDTSQAVSDIRGNRVDTATITDRDQVLELTLKDGSKVRSSYIQGQGLTLQELLQSKVDAGQVPGGYNVVVPSENFLVTLLVSLLPIAIVVLLLFFFMSQMQGGGSRIMNFGKSKAKVITKDMPQTTF
ncbi:MAG: ATP-dependent metallopeptidase FtsH/Yme1/Tma family protein, partial [Actinomycetales bacterium]